ncbi:MAG TPA: VanW family protein [Gaiellaceae bacterium]|nr:VanW family protein [Gaiellaceae bacterium]
MRWVVWVGALVAALVAACAFIGVRAFEYRGESAPGVAVLGVDVGGRDRAQIEEVVRRWGGTEVTIRAGGRTYHVPRSWLVSVDARRTADRALSAGSLAGLVIPQHVAVRPVIGRAGGAGNVLDEIARAGREPVSATVTIHGTSVTTTPAQDGRELDRASLVARLTSGVTSLDAPFTIVHAARRDPAVRSAASAAAALLARPIVVDYHGARLGALTPSQLARALRIVPRAHRFAVSVDGESLAPIVRPRLGRWFVRARNARFAVAGNAVHVVPSRPGRDVDPNRLAVAVTTAAHGDHVARVELGEREPDLTTAGARALGIRTKLVSFTTQMGESSSNRIHNVHLMADLIDGTVIRPGETFSYNAVVGPRTAARGFLEGQEIIGSLVLPSIGGGVCQTATTLFNDAFELGLPILERTNHNLYLSHYPLGRDATVSWGGPDLVFRNDLKHGLLIKASYTDQTLTFTFYGTPSGRRVVSHTGPKTNWTQPKLAYAVDPSAPRNSVRVVPGTGELGFDVIVTRDVYTRDGKLLRHNVFRSRYIPDSPTAVYGPGRTPPGPYFVLPSSV